jgi:hypothetical protein
VSLVHDPSKQVPGSVGATPASAAGTAQSALGGHAMPTTGAGVGAEIWQANPFAQSADVVHCCWARTSGAAARRIVRAPMEKTVLLSDMEPEKCQVRANATGTRWRGQ